jgi:CheY-like chemotaxis protein/anti-anti-sigma regulatory factor
MAPSSFYSLKLTNPIISIEDCKRVSALLKALITSGKKHIAINMEEVSEVSGSFSGFLSEISDLLEQEQGDFIFFNVNRLVTEVLEVVGLGGKIANDFVPSEKGGKPVLVIEDEPLVCALTKEFLVEMGYHCFEADNGLEGLRKYMLFREILEFVVMDVEMPIIDGVHMLQRIVQMDPEVKVIVASGFAQEDKVHMIRQIKEDAILLKKPYLYDEFEKAVKELLALKSKKAS